MKLIEMQRCQGLFSVDSQSGRPAGLKSPATQEAKTTKWEKRGGGGVPPTRAEQPVWCRRKGEGREWRKGGDVGGLLSQALR